MRVLLDSHTLIWAVDDVSRLGPQARVVLQTPANALLLSAGTIWEIAIKVGQGKLSLSMPYRQWMETSIADLGVTVLPITAQYADGQIRLPPHHRDPFDRLLIAQATIENLPLVSADHAFDAYGVTRIW